MQPFLKLAKVWPWLPHFRVVAELESLSRAARRFGVTSAALSKAIRTLEKLVGVELFDRAGGKLRLNEHGRALLGVVRTSMRDIDDAIAAVGVRRGSLRVAVDPALAMLVLAPSSPNLELLGIPTEIAAALLRGDVDVAVHAGELVHPELESVQLAALERSVFGGKPRPEHGDLELPDDAAFSVLDPRGTSTVVVTSLAHAIAWVASGRGAAMLPSAIGRAFGLTEVALERQPSAIALWGTFRRPRGRSPAAEWCELARDHLRSEREPYFR